jgi:hypothetical protein
MIVKLNTTFGVRIKLFGDNRLEVATSDPSKHMDMTCKRKMRPRTKAHNLLCDSRQFNVLV